MDIDEDDIEYRENMITELLPKKNYLIMTVLDFEFKSTSYDDILSKRIKKAKDLEDKLLKEDYAKTFLRANYVIYDKN